MTIRHDYQTPAFRTAIRPVVDRLNRYGISRSIGVILVYLLILVAAASVIALPAPLITQQLSSISEVIPEYYQDVRSTLFLSENLILQRVALNLPDEIELALLPIEARARETYRRIEREVGAYIRSEVIQSLLAEIMRPATRCWG